MEGRITRQALNQSVWRHLIQIREEVAAYAESIGCDMPDVCLFVDEYHASAFSIVENGVKSGKHNVYLIDMRDGKDLYTTSYYEEENRNGQVVSDTE
jgi:hypothetical protein